MTPVSKKWLFNFVVVNIGLLAYAILNFRGTGSLTGFGGVIVINSLMLFSYRRQRDKERKGLPQSSSRF